MRLRLPTHLLSDYGFALLICSAAPAQITLTATAATNLSVWADGSAQTLPQGSGASAVNLSAYGSQSCAGFPFHLYTDTLAEMRTSLDVSDPGRLHFSVFEGGSISDECGRNAWFFTGPHDIRLDFTTATPVSGVLVISWSASDPDPGTSWGASATVDIGNDGTLEFDTSTTPPALSSFSMQLLAGATSVLVHTGTWGMGALNPPPSYESAHLSLHLTFVPNARCAVESFGSSCGDLTMTALPTSLGVNYHVSGLDPNGLGVIVFGATLPVPIALPYAPGCDQLVDLGPAAVHFADGSGSVHAFQNLPGPTSLPPFSISMQFGGLMANGDLLTSNGIRLDCPPN